MTRISILTPDPADADSFASRWRDVLTGYVPLLEAEGLSVESRSWTDEDATGAALVLPLLAWGYHKAQRAWEARTARWQAEGTVVANPAAVLRWNADKVYLGRLEEKGAPVVPTLFVDRLSEGVMADAAARFGTERLVAKPRMSASAWRTIRWSPGQGVEDGPVGPAMIQPYLPSIESAGEVSLIYFAGEFSHAIRKVPQPGDFRVQPEYRGIISGHLPADDERAAAEAVLAAVGEPLLYARIDLVRGAGDRPLLIEAELIEPDLYIGFEEGAGRRFAAAVAQAAKR
ncbi:MAG: RimK family alpha-L-glutamate ligase [Allosphingosinicella sp.]|uniref:ATP-grasp domain-containing protein n=1 Tax=Allosphingosinicella sp. TaxID=2823234 RepID=UPI0039245096